MKPDESKSRSEPSPAERLRDFLADPECHVADDIPDEIWIPFCESLRAPRSELQPIATILQSDPYDEREGPWFAAADLEALRKLPAGTKLFAAKPHERSES